MAEKAKTQEEQVEETAQSLETFDWDTTGSDDFFDIAGTSVAEETAEPKKKETPKPKGGDEEEEEQKEIEQQEETFFEEEEEQEEEEEEQGPTGDYASLTKTFKEKGLFQNIEIPEEEEITEDKFIELQDEEIEARVDEALEGFLEELDDEGAAYLKHKKAGGSTAEFLRVYGQSSEKPQGDLEDEAYQEKLSRFYYKNVEQLDEEDIQDKIEWLKDSGKLSKYAEKHDQKLTENDKKSKEDLQKLTKAQEKAQEDARKNFVNTVQETLDNTDEIDNFKFHKKDKKDLHAFITKPTIKVAKNRFVTGMQDKLQTALKDPEKMLILAKLLKSDFDVSDVVAATTTKTTKKIKKDLQRASTVRPASSGKSNKRRSLADMDF